MNPKVSIIIPNYNHALFLQERLDSVFNQTFQDFEVILLDDASTDGSVDLLNQYKDHPKVSHVVMNNENSGSPFKQWQRGIELAKGDYIWIAESDDYCELNFLESLLLFLKDEETVLAYCATKHFDEIQKSVYLDKWASQLDKVRWQSNYTNIGCLEIKYYFRYRNIIPNASAVLFKRTAILRVELPLEMKFCGDWLIWLKLLQYGDIAYCCLPLNYFRKHEKTTRVFKGFVVENQRFNEYKFIVKQYSSFIDRVINLGKYKWIVLECYLKRKTVGKFPNFKLKLPIEFQIAYVLLILGNKINK
ncbi:glycosyltransferase family 2 protein [Thalassobellus suaedae]|uniref:Glycosyltransferase family 2 protein n=1 Tax=Thalassobellus suaedae TaxID=3074124 RepID=A0ABY9Y062_9FLAO|nr:glycosyltransferase family 2 protein [Flavobacteriaceae bacterium HL-DH10]